MLRFEKNIKDGKIRISKKEIKRMEDEMFLLVFPSKVILMDMELWQENLIKYLSEARTRKERRRRKRFYCAKSYKIRINKPGEISLPKAN